MAVVKIIVSLTVLTLLSIAWQVEAATIIAASCSRTAVGSAVTSASDGDIVQVPAGTCSWTAKLTITKGITLQGAGIDQTILMDDIAPRDSMIAFQVNFPNRFGLTGFTFTRGITTVVHWQGAVNTGGSTKAFRIHHNKFQNLVPRVIHFNGDMWGVVDHNDFILDQGAFLIGHSNWGGIGQFGDNSWATPNNYGTEKFIFIETNTFTSTGAKGITDDTEGGRFVFRYNTVMNGSVETHGTESGQRNRGGRVREVYNNTFSLAAPVASLDGIVHFRSGTGLIHNNTVLNGYYNYFFKGDNYRDAGFAPSEWGGFCDGDAPYDQNMPGQAGYACLDQVGRGPGVLLSGGGFGVANGATPRGWPNQALEPVYLWNNSLTAAFRYGQAGGGSAKIQVGRDILVNTVKPGYTPYVYPHPLVGSSVGPSLPTGVTVR